MAQIHKLHVCIFCNFYPRRPYPKIFFLRMVELYFFHFWNYKYPMSHFTVLPPNSPLNPSILSFKFLKYSFHCCYMDIKVFVYT